MSHGRRLQERLARGETIDFRGDGKAGGGLVLVVQAFSAALSAAGDLDAQDWPLFSSARKGANVRAYLRVARGRVEATCQVTEPEVALLMNEAAAEVVDFAEGTNGALYVVNTPAGPAETAQRYRLGGTVATIAGDALGQKHLGRPLGNVGVLAALVRTTELVDRETARDALANLLKKRRLPERIVEHNLALFEEAFEHVRIAEFPVGDATSHGRKAPRGYGRLPAGAQGALRSSKENRTSGYGRPGVRVEFSDPTSRCNGCSLCVVQCPEGIIEFEADASRGTIVQGARFTDYCKACRECIVACPLDLFSELPVVAPPDGALTQGA